MKNTSIKTTLLSFIATLRRYMVTIFIVLIVGGLSSAVILLNSILQDASDTTGITSSLDNTSFDQATIDRVQQLHTSDDSLPELTLPNGRVNPFAE